MKIATDNDTNLPPEKLKAATQNEKNDGCLIVKNRPRGVIDVRLSNGSIPAYSGQSILANQLALPAKRHTSKWGYVKLCPTNGRFMNLAKKT